MKNRDDLELVGARGAAWLAGDVADGLTRRRAPARRRLAAALVTALTGAGPPAPPDRAARLAEALRLVPPVDRATSSTGPAGWCWCPPASSAGVRRRLRAPCSTGMLDPADSRAAIPRAPPPIGGRSRAPAPTPPRRAPEPRRRRRRTPRAAAAGGTARRRTTGREAASWPWPRRRAAARHVLRRPHRRRSCDEMRRAGAAAACSPHRERLQPPHPAEHRAATRLDLRRTVRAARRTGGDPPRLVTPAGDRSRGGWCCCATSPARWSPTRGSSCRCCRARSPGPRAEAFVFSTRLTRLTRQLAARDPDQALARAAATAPGLGRRHPDRREPPALRRRPRPPRPGPGRRGGDLLRRLGAGRSGAGRRGRCAGCAGWPTGSSGSTRARRRRGYRPLVGGMAAALPYCDAFVSGHSLAALERVVAAVRDDSG